MNTQVFTHVMSCTKSFSGKSSAKLVVTLLATLFICDIAQADWNVDFSRRAKSVREGDLHAAGADTRAPASVRAASDGGGAQMSAETAHVGEAPKKGVFDQLFDAGEPVQEIVIMNTDRGFVPSTVRVRKNGRYKIHIVNVNEKEKNVSFILDGFSEHHATFYGKVKSFFLEPRKDGVFSFQSPETAAEGKLVVFNPQISVRAPASEDSK